MGLADLVRSKVALAQKLTSDFDGTVTITPWVGQNGIGDAEYGTPYPAQAKIDMTKAYRRTATGGLAMTDGQVLILTVPADVAPNAGHTREQPLDPKDIITLPDGSSQPIVRGGGFMDSGTIRPFYLDILLGAVGG